MFKVQSFFFGEQWVYVVEYSSQIRTSVNNYRLMIVLEDENKNKS